MIWCWLVGHRWFLMPNKNIMGEHIVMCQRCLKQRYV